MTTDVFICCTSCQVSTLDVGLPDGTQDREYLGAVSEVLPSALTSFRPDIVLYDAGVDVHMDDALGRLQVSTAARWPVCSSYVTLVPEPQALLFLLGNTSFPHSLFCLTQASSTSHTSHTSHTRCQTKA